MLLALLWVPNWTYLLKESILPSNCFRGYNCFLPKVILSRDFLLFLRSYRTPFGRFRHYGDTILHFAFISSIFETTILTMMITTWYLLIAEYGFRNSHLSKALMFYEYTMRATLTSNKSLGRHLLDDLFFQRELMYSCISTLLQFLHDRQRLLIHAIPVFTIASSHHITTELSPQNR